MIWLAKMVNRTQAAQVSGHKLEETGVRAQKEGHRCQGQLIGHGMSPSPWTFCFSRSNIDTCRGALSTVLSSALSRYCHTLSRHYHDPVSVGVRCSSSSLTDRRVRDEKPVRTPSFGFRGSTRVDDDQVACLKPGNVRSRVRLCARHTATFKKVQRSLRHQGVN
ncbi:hypothetical protein Btru_028191 [Bulinus truncatus]|nr:hypothetical protein Btru_028191 [Bulinus truncatus]